MVLGVLGFGLVRFTVHNASPANDSCYMHKDANNSARKPYIRMGGACGDRELIEIKHGRGVLNATSTLGMKVPSCSPDAP